MKYVERVSIPTGQKLNEKSLKHYT